MKTGNRIIAAGIVWATLLLGVLCRAQSGDAAGGTGQFPGAPALTTQTLVSAIVASSATLFTGKGTIHVGDYDIRQTATRAKNDGVEVVCVDLEILDKTGEVFATGRVFPGKSRDDAAHSLMVASMMDPLSAGKASNRRRIKAYGIGDIGFSEGTFDEKTKAITHDYSSIDFAQGATAVTLRTRKKPGDARVLATQITQALVEEQAAYEALIDRALADAPTTPTAAAAVTTRTAAGAAVVRPRADGR